MNKKLTQKQRDELAEFMGFGAANGWYHIEGVPFIAFMDWQPGKKIEHSMMLLDKFDDCQIIRVDGVWKANILVTVQEWVLEIDDDIRMAICKAVLKAKEAIK